MIMQWGHHFRLDMLSDKLRQRYPWYWALNFLLSFHIGFFERGYLILSRRRIFFRYCGLISKDGNFETHNIAAAGGG